ncbi:uncharacterized protein LOC121248197 isoform X2 [Juglans microcarpa x Juglans regia]|uniref:uncharacterized protein LOC121248197 isoform X2 n=1 Tax=Juglans microcarpa x Juglans regia TaxID=2249226 RepID=UPI001B7ED930|nr:uncharacterized protein LOC121248197 isoform X2 [Juglans microcarpa x Juglans regia]
MKFIRNSNMVYLRFTSFVLIGLLFVMHALGDSSACTHQAGHEEGLAVAAKGKNVAVPKGVLLLDGGNAFGLRNIGFGAGRKMAEQKVLSKEIEVEDRVNGAGTTSEISGKDSNASKNSPGRSSQDQKVSNDQSNKKTLPKASKSAGLGSPRSKLTAHFPNTKPERTQDSKAVPTKASLGSSSRSDKPIFSQETHHDQTTASDHQRDIETQRLLEATKEIVSLMHKDYGKMARRPPPSNNHEPWH